MAFKFEQLGLQQRKKALVILFAYLFTGALAIYLMLMLTAYTDILSSMLMSLLLALGVGWVLTKIVDYFIPIRCPNCSSPTLTENFTLPCKMPEYQCDQCQKVYSE